MADTPANKIKEEKVNTVVHFSDRLQVIETA